jgi:hypothetical protein
MQLELLLAKLGTMVIYSMPTQQLPVHFQIKSHQLENGNLLLLP